MRECSLYEKARLGEDHDIKCRLREKNGKKIEISYLKKNGLYKTQLIRFRKTFKAWY